MTRDFIIVSNYAPMFAHDSKARMFAGMVGFHLGSVCVCVIVLSGAFHHLGALSHAQEGSGVEIAN